MYIYENGEIHSIVYVKVTHEDKSRTVTHFV